MARITARQKRGQALLAYGRRVAQAQQDAAVAKALVSVSKAEAPQQVCEVPQPRSADGDGFVCANCRRPLSEHCVEHTIPCCPGTCPKEQ